MPGRRLTQAELDAQAQTLSGQEFDERLKWIQAEMQRLGYPVRLLSKNRTAEQQARLFAQGRTRPGAIVTEKSGQPGDESLHQRGRAADFAFIGRASPWDVLGRVAKQYGLEWGGDWTSLVDKPHVQLGARPGTAFPAGGPARGITDPTSVQTRRDARTLPPLAAVAPAVAAEPAPAPAPQRPAPMVARGSTDPASLTVTPPPGPAPAQGPQRPAPMVARGYTDPASLKVTPAPPILTGRRPAPMDAHGITDPASVKITPPKGAPLEERPATWADIIASIAEEEDLNPSLAVAVAEQENESFDPAAVSERGAIGLMQLMPETAKKHNVDPNDPMANIRGGVRELKALTAKYGDDLDRALAAYNAGESAVDAAGGVPDNPAVQAYLYGSDVRPGVISRIGKYADVRPARQETPKEPAPKDPGTIGPGPGPGWEVSRSVTPAAGAMLGGYYGGVHGLAAGAPFGPYAAAAGLVGGAVAGAYAGGFGGEGFELALETLAQKIGLGSTGLKPISPAGATSRLTSAGETAATAEAIGGVAGPVVGKVAGPFASKLAPYAQQARQVMGQTVILPGQLTTSKLLRTVQNVVEESILGSGPMTAARQAGQKKAEERVLEVLDQLGPKTPAQSAGAAVQQRLPPPPSAAAEARFTQTRTAAEARRAAESVRVGRAETDAAARRAGETVADAARRQAGEATAARTQTALGGPVETAAAGTTVQAGREAAIQEFRSMERAAWGNYEAEAADVTMEATPTLDAFIEKVTGRTKGTLLPNAGVSVAQRVADLLDPAMDTGQIRIGPGRALLKDAPESVQTAVMAALKEKVEPVSAVEFARTVSDLGTLSRSLRDAAKSDPSKFGKQAGLARELYRIARTELAETLGPVNAPARQAYEAATSMTRQGQARLFNKTVLRMAQQDPDKVLGSLLKPNNGVAVRRVTQAVGEAGMAPIRAAGWQRIIKRDVETGGINWPATVRTINELDDTLRVVYPGGEHQALRRVGEGMFEAEHLAAQTKLADQQAIALMKQEAAVGTATDAVALRTAQRDLVAARRQMDLFKPLRNETQTARVLTKLLRKDNVATITAVREAVGDAFQPTQRIMLDRLSGRNPRTGDIDWGKLADNFAKYDKESLDAFFPGGHAEQIRKIAGTMLSLQQREGLGRLAVQIGEAGMISGLVWKFQLPKTAAVVMLAGPALSRVMSSPIGSRWLAEGLAAHPATPAARQAAAQLIAFLRRDVADEKATAAPAAAPVAATR